MSKSTFFPYKRSKFALITSAISTKTDAEYTAPQFSFDSIIKMIEYCALKGVCNMPTIKPISDLRNKANEISELAHKLNEPIFITKNGEGDMVVMSMAQYAQLQLKLDLFGKLAVAQSQIAAGDKGRTLKQVMKDIRKRLHESS